MSEVNRKQYVYDLETHPDAFIAVFKELGNPKKEAWKIYCITSFSMNEYRNLRSFLNGDRISLIGYNNIDFDAQILQYIINEKIDDPEKIYQFGQDLINRDRDERTPYAPWNFTIKNMDYFRVGSYNAPALRTSLKWLAFSMRMPKLQDLPYEHDELLGSEAKLKKVISYCRKDVLDTERVAEAHSEYLDMRRELYRKYKDENLFNKGNAQIGEYIILKEYEKKTGTNAQKLKDLRREPDEIKLEDIIIPYINFNNDCFKEVLDTFKSIVLTRDSKESVINLKGGIKDIDTETHGCHIKYGLGGVHGCVDPQLIKSTEDKIIISADVASMYPNIAIQNKFFPQHMGEEFCEVYEDIYHTRKKFPKGSPLNLGYKLSLNSIYGKSNSAWSPLRDPVYTLKTTINGQLLLSMLADRLIEIAQPIMLNTDGLEFLVDKDMIEKYYKICKAWENLTGLELEYDEYDFMAIRDVNNYIARNKDGKVKRKGQYATWEDYKGTWHKNPSYMVIPGIVSVYFETGIPPEISIEEYTNIYDYLGGVKKKRNFEHWLFTPKENGVVKLDKYKERVIRYYASMNGGTLFKHYNDGRKNNIGYVSGTSETTLSMLLDIKEEHIDNYPDLNKQFYIDEAYKLINAIITEQ